MAVKKGIQENHRALTGSEGDNSEEERRLRPINKYLSYSRSQPHAPLGNDAPTLTHQSPATL